MNTKERALGKSISKKSISIRLLPVIGGAVAILVHILLPNQQSIGSLEYYTGFLSILLGIYVMFFAASLIFSKVKEIYENHAPLDFAVMVLLIILELLTLKYNVLPLPFFPSPVKILEAYVFDYPKLLNCVICSMRLLFLGYFLGVFFGLVTGILMGWFTKFKYWVNPIVRFIGPIPVAAWIPVVLVAFPTSFSGSVFLIALTTWFPVTVMTWSGISNVKLSYLNIAKTLGANQLYLIFRVALPDAMSLIFVGLFMGLGTAFVGLVTAEMLGVKAGLGWYIQWSQGYGEYYKLYACLIVSAILFSTIIKLLFVIRDKLLSWQNGLIKW